MSHWTEEFFVDNGELFVQELEEKGDRATQEVEKLLSLLRDTFGHDPSSVLDVGCGLGRHCREFASTERTVTGIDISPEYLAQARKRATEGGFNDRIDLYELDMRELDSLNEEFDLVVCLYNTFGYFEDETNVDILQKIRDQLTDDGMCVIQTMNKDAMLTSITTEHVRELESSLVVEQSDFDSTTSRVTITRDVLRGDPPELTYDGRATYTIRLYSPPELKRAFADAGFTDVALFGDYDGNSLSTERGHMIALAR